MHHIDMLGARERMALQPHLDAFAGKGASDTRDVVASAHNESGFFGEDGFGFDDLLDLINPLQHIPLVSTAYRALTGDQIAPGARVMGGALFGGPVGLASALANTALEATTGKDIGDTVLAFFSGDSDAPAPAPGQDIVPEPDIMLADDGVSRPLEVASTEARAPSSTRPLVDGLVAPSTAEATAAPADIPELSADQVALLLGSVSLSPEAAKSATPVVSRTQPAAPQAPAAVTAAPAPTRSTPQPGPTPDPSPMRPVATTSRTEAKPTQAIWQPFAQGVDPTDMPEEMLSEAMAWALDKYESEFGALTTKPRGQTHDSGA